MAPGHSSIPVHLWCYNWPYWAGRYSLVLLFSFFCFTRGGNIWLHKIKEELLWLTWLVLHAGIICSFLSLFSFLFFLHVFRCTFLPWHGMAQLFLTFPNYLFVRKKGVGVAGTGGMGGWKYIKTHFDTVSSIAEFVVSNGFGYHVWLRIFKINV